MCIKSLISYFFEECHTSKQRASVESLASARATLTGVRRRHLLTDGYIILFLYGFLICNCY